VRPKQERSPACLGLRPPLAGSPGGERRTRAPGAAAVAAPAAGARPGCASWGGSAGRGDGRARARRGARAVPGRGQEPPGLLLLKGQCTRTVGPTRQELQNRVADTGRRAGRRDLGGLPAPKKLGKVGANPGGNPGLGPAHVIAVGGALGGGATFAGPAQRQYHPGPRPQASGPGRLLPRPGFRLSSSSRPASCSGIHLAAASGAEAKCGPKRSRSGALSSPGPQIPQFRTPQPPPQAQSALSGLALASRHRIPFRARLPPRLWLAYANC
jgi:hypothetical protein